MCVYSTARGPAVSVARVPDACPVRVARATSRRPVTHTLTHTQAMLEGKRKQIIEGGDGPALKWTTWRALVSLLSPYGRRG
eukprot:7110088-Prymnesium_polylepis.1